MKCAIKGMPHFEIFIAAMSVSNLFQNIKNNIQNSNNENENWEKCVKSDKIVF